MATFRVGDLIKEQPDGSRALQTTLTGSDNVVKAELTGSIVAEQEILKNIIIPANSFLQEEISLIGNRIVVGVRSGLGEDALESFRVSVQFAGKDVSVFDDFSNNEIINVSKRLGAGEFYNKSSRAFLRIRNTGVSDALIEGVVITEFL